MVVTSIKPPSLLQFITFPVFALTWHASPPGGPHTCTALAYCGGGGSAKTGVDNSVHVVIQTLSEGERTVKISTGLDIGVGVALFQVENSLLVLVALGDDIKLYSIPVLIGGAAIGGGIEAEGEQPEDEAAQQEGETEPKSEAKLLAEATLGEKYGANAVSFNPMGNGFAVGCENGILCVYSLAYTPSSDHNNNEDAKPESAKIAKFVELEGHIKAICTISFHPRSAYILGTSAKDGTCRIWDLKSKSCFDTLSCKIYDPSQPPPADQKIANPKPGQLLVRGCAFGNLQGDILYTVQSGRKGGAFLSVWRIVSVPAPAPEESQQSSGGNNPPPSTSEDRPPPSQEPQGQKPAPQQQPQTIQKFQEVHRQQIAPYPVSAMALSGDFSTLAFGDTNGTITLFSIETMKPIKSWESIHDLPVTCIAARPLPLEFPGDDQLGVMMDAVSASADNKLLFLTRARKSKNKAKRGNGGGSSFLRLWSFMNLAIMMIIAFILKVSFDVCKDEFVDVGQLEPVVECIRNTVFWAPENRPGVLEIPQ